MEGHLQNPAPHGTPCSPASGDLGDRVVVVDGLVTNAPAGFDRTCALLAEAVIGMIASSQSLSSGQAARTSGPVRADSQQALGIGATRSAFNLDERIVEELRQGGSSSPTALRSKLGIARTPCTKALNRLVAKGMLISQGSTRDRVYRLVQSNQPVAA